MIRFCHFIIITFFLLSICIISYGQVPTANPDIAATNEDTNITFDVVGNDEDALLGINPASVDLDVSSLGIQDATTTSEGAWSVDASGQVTYVPVENFFGTAQISYTVRNTLLIPSNQTTITVEVSPVNDAPEISTIGNQTTDQGVATNPIDFTLSDVDTPLGNLSISGSSSDASLISDANITFTGTGADRTVTLTPNPGQNGSATITITVDDGEAQDDVQFLLTVEENTSPTISNIGNQSTGQDVPTDAIPFTIGDNETPLDDLTVSGTSSNTTLVDNTNIVFGGSGADWNVTITPSAGQSGSAIITIEVSDGDLTASENFTLTVTANQAPTISSIGPQTTAENTPTDAIEFTIADAETPVANLIVSGSSSNTTLIPNTGANISFGGSGATRSLILTPASGQSGNADITVTVSDGSESTSTVFELTVVGNEAPTISAIAAQTTALNTATPPIGFTVGDAESPANSLTLTAASSNTSLVQNGNISFGGGGPNRNVIITPETGQSGETTISITVSDGVRTAVSSFTLTVNGNQAPTISAIAPQSTEESTPIGPIPFTVGDEESQAASLTVSASSSNIALVPNTNISLTGNGTSRNVTISPTASASGETTITLTVSDGTDETSVTFTLTVVPINDAPTITPIGPQTTAENTPTEPIPFIIGDAETPASNLIVTGVSANTTLVPNSGFLFQGTGSERTVVITPAPGQNGTVNITITVDDQTAPPVSRTFALTVTSTNDTPTITDIAAQSIDEDGETPALPFTIGDSDTPVDQLQVSASSSNKTLIPDENIILFGNGISRTVTVSAAENQTGESTITLTVSDGTLTASTSFIVTVGDVNDAPVISSIAPQTTSENTPTPALPFQVSDLESNAATLTVTAASSNILLVPNSNITLAGTGENRTVTITPANGLSGETTITLTVSDGSGSASTSFAVTVTSINDVPTISTIAPQTTNEDVATASIPFTIADAESPASGLSVTGSSSNKTLVPDGNITITGSGLTRTVRVVPAADAHGTTTITLTVSDGSASAQTSFVLTVVPVNDPPTITAQVDLSTPEDTPITLLPEHFTINDPDNTPAEYSIIVVQSENYSVTGGSTVTPPVDFDGELIVVVKVSDGKVMSQEFNAIITVTDVNIPPRITGQTPIPLTITVNTSITLQPTSNILVTDPDSPQEDITLIAAEGDNYVLTGTGLTTVAPLANYFGPLSVSVRASDGKATSDPFIVEIDVVPTSERPLITGHLPLIIDEDNTLTLRLEDLIVSDEDDQNYPTGFSMEILPGILPEGNYSVDGLNVTPGPNFNGFMNVRVWVNDGEQNSPEFNVRVYVVPINDAPEITDLESSPIFYEPGTGPIPITSDFTFIDVDSDFMTLAEIGLIDSNYNPANDELIFENTDTSPIRGVYDAQRGVLSLIGYATKEDYIAAVRNVKYNYRLTIDNTGEQSEISTAPKKLYINISDGPAVSNNREREIELETTVELIIPNAFTPNGDQSNDTWAVTPVIKTDQYQETIIRVYNKRGLLVYESVGLEAEWEGTFNGEMLPVDTYYYTIDLKLSFIKKTYKGAVTILR